MLFKLKNTDKPEELEISNVTYDDQGWYVCIAANSLGRTTAKAYLSVVDVLSGRNSFIYWQLYSLNSMENF